MALTFGRNKTTGKKVFSAERNLIETVLGKRTKTQLQNIVNELIRGGFIQSEKDITKQLLEEYRVFKSFLPRTDYNKMILETTEKLLAKFPDTIVAEDVYYLLNDISEISDAAIYYWFNRLDVKFSARGVYPKPICKTVVYMALCRKARLDKEVVNSQ